MNEEESSVQDVEEPVLRYSDREQRCSDFYGEWVSLAGKLMEPRTVDEALSSPDGKKWKNAMEMELESLHSNDVWELVEMPKNRKLINSKWVFKCKIGAGGEIESYKAKLVAQRYSQRPGLDYEETFLQL